MKTKTQAVLNRFLQTAGICFLLGINFTAKAQYEPQFTQYMNNEQFINPAYAGTREHLAATMLYRYQWAGIEGAPRTATFGVHSPFMYNKIGVGLCIMNDRIGVTNQTGVFANYAYHLPTSENGTLSFGLQGGFINIKENLLDLITIEENDPEFSNNIPNKLMPNFGYGMYYHTKKFYAGFSIPRFLENKVDAMSLKKYNKMNIHNWHYYMYSAYVFDGNESVKFKPSVMIKAVQGAPVEADVNLNVLFKNLFWVGAAYRTGDAVALLTQFQLTKQLRFGYSYDYALTRLNNYSSGSHEFTLGWDLIVDKDKIVTPRYF